MLIQRRLSPRRENSYPDCPKRANLRAEAELQFQKELQEAPIRRTIDSFKAALEEFLHKAIASFEHGWPDINHLQDEFKHTENFLRSKHTILGNMIGHEITRNSGLGNYLYDQFKDLPALIQRATALQKEYYQVQNAQGHYPPICTFYDGSEFWLKKYLIDPVKPNAINIIELKELGTKSRSEDKVDEPRTLSRSWHHPPANTARRRPSLELLTSSKLHQTAK